MALGNTHKRMWKRERDIVQQESEIFLDGQASDVVILVMGKPGVGKSEFINTVLEKPSMQVGRGNASEPCTANVKWEVIDPELVKRICPRWGDHRVVIVDTPGFATPNGDDAESLRRIAAWLAPCYADGMKIGGAIFLHNILDKKVDDVDRLNLEMFKKLCGDEALRQAVLGTTRWEEVNPETGETREKSFGETFWGEMIAQGCTIARFNHTQQSAIEIIRGILERHLDKPDDCVPMLIQRELVDMRKYLPQTEVGKELLSGIEQAMRNYKGMKSEEMCQGQVEALERQLEKMRLSFFTKVKLFLGY